MFGQHALLKRYLSNNRHPHAVIVAGRSPFGFNLKQTLTENYVQRVFTRPPEILAMIRDKRSLSFGAKAATYHLLTSYKYRLHLQKEIIGFTNADIYTGATHRKQTRAAQPPTKQKKRIDHGLFASLERHQLKTRKKAISDEHLERMIRLCEEHQIFLYYLPAPMRESEASGKRDTVEATFARLRHLDQQSPFFIFLEEEFRAYPDTFFGDPVHLTPKGVEKAESDTLQIMTDIVLKTRPEYSQ